MCYAARQFKEPEVEETVKLISLTRPRVMMQTSASDYEQTNFIIMCDWYTEKTPGKLYFILDATEYKTIDIPDFTSLISGLKSKLTIQL